MIPTDTGTMSETLRQPPGHGALRSASVRLSWHVGLKTRKSWEVVGRWGMCPCNATATTVSMSDSNHTQTQLNTPLLTANEWQIKQTHQDGLSRIPSGARFGSIGNLRSRGTITPTFHWWRSSHSQLLIWSESGTAWNQAKPAHIESQWCQTHGHTQANQNERTWEGLWVSCSDCILQQIPKLRPQVRFE